MTTPLLVEGYTFLLIARRSVESDVHLLAHSLLIVSPSSSLEHRYQYGSNMSAESLSCIRDAFHSALEDSSHTLSYSVSNHDSDREVGSDDDSEDDWELGDDLEIANLCDEELEESFESGMESDWETEEQGTSCRALDPIFY